MLFWLRSGLYLKEQWPYLTNYLKDGRLEISNNRAERSIKPFVIDRKNFLFANTPKGATGSAVMFSLIQTAIENGLEPYNYLTWLLRKAKDADLTDAEVVQRLLVVSRVMRKFNFGIWQKSITGGASAPLGYLSAVRAQRVKGGVSRSSCP